MDPCITLLEKLNRHPELVHYKFLGGVRIEPCGSNGFAVELFGDDEKWTVHCGTGGFHETFNSAEEALNFVAWCYSGTARLREMWRGNSPEKSVLEGCDDGEWRQVSVTGFFFVPFWRKRREIILQNPNLLKD